MPAAPRLHETDSSVIHIGGQTMLYTIAVVLAVLWLLGFLTDMLGGLIHILLVIAAIVLIYQLVTGKRGTP